MVRKRTLRLLCAACRSSDFFHRILQSEKYPSSEARQTCHSLIWIYSVRKGEIRPAAVI